MKKNQIIFFLIFMISVADIALASRIHQEDGILPNHSAEFVRTLNRNASLSADAAFYNPAGLAFMDDGLHVMFSGQLTYARREHTMDYYAISVEGSNNDEFVQTFHTRSPFEHTNMPEKYYAETTAPVMPDIDIIYKKNNWAAYFDFSVMQAAPKMHYPYGLAVMDWGCLAVRETSYAEALSDNPENPAEFRGYYRESTATRTESFIGLTFGGAYAVNNRLSFSGGLRVIKAEGNMTLGIKNITYTEGENDAVEYIDTKEEWDIDTDYEGIGFGFIFGADYRFSDSLNIGMKYEYYLPLEVEKTTNKFKTFETIEKNGNLDIFKDGSDPKQMEGYANGNGNSKHKMTYPPCLSAGVSYNLLDNLRMESSAEITFRAERDLDGREDDYNMGYKLGTGFEWTIKQDLTASIGYLYNNFGIKDDKRDEADPLLPSHSVGTGFGIKLSENADLSLGAMYMFLEKKHVDKLEESNVSALTYHAIRKDFKEKRFIMAVGITYKFDNIF